MLLFNSNQQSEADHKLIISYLVEEKIKDNYKQLMPFENNTSRKNIISIRFIVKIAAIFIFAVLATTFIFQLSKPNSKEMAAKFLSETKILGNQQFMRKNLDQNEELLIKANLEFVKANYEKVIEYYLLISQSYNLIDDDYFYLGISFLKAKNSNPQKALECFDSIKNFALYENEILWFKSLAYLELNQNDEAIAELNQLINNNNYKKNEAIKLLNALRK